MFCGKQNISLRGHRNERIIVSHDGQGAERSASLIQKEDGNPGNFLALLKFREKSGDASIIRDFHLHQEGSGLRRVNYCSPTSQNELISCCAEYIREEILKKARNAPLFSAIADETADSANMEHMPLGGIPRLCELWHWSVRLNGRAAVAQRELPKALYCHCNVHALNLCVIGISRISLESNMCTALKEVSLFFENSPKQQQKLESIINDFPPETLNNTRKTKLVSLCRTRWVHRHTAMESFDDLYPAVVATFDLYPAVVATFDLYPAVVATFDLYPAVVATFDLYPAVVATFDLYPAVVATFEDIADNRAAWSADSCGTISSLKRTVMDFSSIVTFLHSLIYSKGCPLACKKRHLIFAKHISKSATSRQHWHSFGGILISTTPLGGRRQYRW